MMLIIQILILQCLGHPIQNNFQEVVCLSGEEKKLFQLIMDYRQSKGLPPIPLSKSLTIVAQAHAKDLQNNNPVSKRCNLHSWSGKGEWSKCCYTNDHRRASCMWDKPRELTNYRGNGYEIAHWNSLAATAVSSIEGWKKSRGHNMVMINRGIWKDVKWKAIGIGIYDQYAVVWFGEEKDLVSNIQLCE